MSDSGVLTLGHLPTNLNVSVEAVHKFTSFIFIVTFTFSPTAVIGTNFAACLANVQQGLYGVGVDIGGTDNHGRPVNVSVATGLTYKLCLEACGGGQEPFNWSVFSMQFTSWLVPWLALISQLPFGANDKVDNLISVFLTVGSPTLATYSFVLTVLNQRWVNDRFKYYAFPNVKKAVNILISLQQAPLEIDAKLLPSLVILHQNDQWWSTLFKRLNYLDHTWSISAFASIAWVVLAFAFTLVDSFIGNIATFINANGQGVGLLWLWLLPIVVGWLKISPKCDSHRLLSAVQEANKTVYVATNDASLNPEQPRKGARAIIVRLSESLTNTESLDPDSTPVPVPTYPPTTKLVPAIQLPSTAESLGPVHTSVPTYSPRRNDLQNFLESPNLPSFQLPMAESDPNYASGYRPTRNDSQHVPVSQNPTLAGTSTSILGRSLGSTPGGSQHNINRVDCQGDQPDEEANQNPWGRLAPLRQDEGCTAPIYNYARFFPWVREVEKVSEVFKEASYKSHKLVPVTGRSENWVADDKYEFNNANRVGTLTQVNAYCQPRQSDQRHWRLESLKRIFFASVLALMLQWGTAGAAIIVNWFTPTRGESLEHGQILALVCFCSSLSPTRTRLPFWLVPSLCSTLHFCLDATS